MTLDRFPCASRGDAHRLVVVARRTTRGKSIPEPEIILRCNIIGDIGERRRALVRSDDEIRVVTVSTHHRPRGDDRTGVLVEVVCDVEQAGDEISILRNTFGARGVTVRGGVTGRCGRPLDDESALGADGHDHRVLDGLRLDQTQDLGAEILASIRPAQSAAGNGTETQVHPFDARRVHEDLVQWPRLGRLRNLPGPQLERHHRSVGVVVADVEVGARRRPDDGRERRDDAVGFESEDLADVVAERSCRTVALLFVGVVGVERRLEQLDQSPRDIAVLAEGVRNQGVAVREAALAQVPTVRTKHRRGTPVEAAPDDQLVVGVDLCALPPDLHEGIGEPPVEVVGGVEIHRHPVGQRDTEFVDVADLPVRPHEAVRMLVDDVEAEAVEHRQHVGQGGCAAAQIQRELPQRPGLAAGLRQRHGDVAGVEIGDTDEVGECVRRLALVLVILGQRRKQPKQGVDAADGKPGRRRVESARRFAEPLVPRPD